MLEVESIKTVFARRGSIRDGERLIIYDEDITPEQQALLRGLNFRGYPTIQELYWDKVSNNIEDSKENDENLTEDNFRYREGDG